MGQGGATFDMGHTDQRMARTRVSGKKEADFPSLTLRATELPMDYAEGPGGTDVARRLCAQHRIDLSVPAIIEPL